MSRSYQTGGSHGDILPMDQVSFNFAKIEYEYKPQKADGSLACGGQRRLGCKGERTKV